MFLRTISGVDLGTSSGHVTKNMRRILQIRISKSGSYPVICLAYPINFNLHPDVYAYFKSLGYTMDKDKYSLSMMVQWVWRSAIRKGEEIWLYVPSARMRGLFTDWLEEVSGG